MSNHKTHFSIILTLLAWLCFFQQANSMSLNTQSMLLAEHTGIELRSVSKDICSSDLILATKSSLAGPLFHESESFRSRILSHNLRQSIDQCIRRGTNSRSYRVSIFFNDSSSGTLKLLAKRENNELVFSTSDYVAGNQSAKTSSFDFYDRALARMAGSEIARVFPNLDIPKLSVKEIPGLAPNEPDAAFLMALATDKRRGNSIFDKLFYRQGAAINSCDFNRPTMEWASEAGSAFASYLVSDCIFSKAHITNGTAPSIREAQIDLSSLSDEDFLKLIFHTAKFMHNSRILVDGLDLASNVRYYGGKTLLSHAQTFVDSQPVDLSFREYQQHLLKEYKARSSK